MTMYGKMFSKLLTVYGICMACFLSQAPVVHAADTYSVIYNDVSAWNGDATQADWITSAILYASGQYGVDPLLVTAVMETESHFNIGAGSGAGAIGLMQLMPDTASSIGVNPYDPLGNVLGGVAHLRTLLDSFAGWGTYAVTDAVAAYNAGSGAIQQYSGVPPYRETRNYVIKVSNAYNALLANCS
jgi:soluble lytic murein transglycosylase-like protein